MIATKFTGVFSRGWYREHSLRSGYEYQLYAYLRGPGDPPVDPDLRDYILLITILVAFLEAAAQQLTPRPPAVVMGFANQTPLGFRRAYAPEALMPLLSPGPSGTPPGFLAVWCVLRVNTAGPSHAAAPRRYGHGPGPGPGPGSPRCRGTMLGPIGLLINSGSLFRAVGPR